MRKIALFCAAFMVLAATDAAAEQCTVLSDAEYAKLYNNHTMSVQRVIDEATYPEEVLQLDIHFLENGDFASTWYLYFDHIETLRFNFKGNWAIHDSVLSMNVSECNHTKSNDPSENNVGDEICQASIGGSFEPIKLNPCNPYYWEYFNEFSIISH